MIRILLIFLVLIAGCGAPSQKNSTLTQDSNAVEATASDQTEANLVVYEYIITNSLPSPSSGRIYVPLDNNEKRLLKARVAQVDIRGSSLDSKSRRPSRRPAHSHFINVHQIKMDGRVAKAEASWAVDGAIRVYEVDLVKESQWSVTNAVVIRAMFR